MGWRPVGDYALPAALPHKLYLDFAPTIYRAPGFFRAGGAIQPIDCASTLDLLVA